MSSFTELKTNELCDIDGGSLFAALVISEVAIFVIAEIYLTAANAALDAKMNKYQ